MDATRQRIGLPLFVLGLGLFMALLDATVVNIGVPAIMEDFKADVSRVSWVLNAYTLALAVVLITMGRLADQFGRKRLYLLGLTVFTGFSLLCGLSWDISWLIAFRAFQGVGAAILLSVSLAMVTRLFPPERQGVGMGIWAAIGMTAAAAGPTLGGLIIEYLSWHWIFYLNLPVGIVALLLGWMILVESKDPSAPRQVDFLGVLTLSISAFSLVLALMEGQDNGWSSTYIVSLFALAAVFFVAFVAVEGRQAHPMVDLRLFRSATFSGSWLTLLLVGFGMMGAIFLLVIFMVNVMGYSELRAAIAVTPIAATSLIVAPIAGRLCDRIGSRIPAMLAVVCLGLGLYLLSQLGADSKWADVAWRAVIIGVGLGLGNAALTVGAMSAVAPAKAGVASGVINMARQLGFVFGIAICVALYSGALSGELNDAREEAAALISADQQMPQAAKEKALAAVAHIGEQEGPQSAPDLAGMADEMGPQAAALRAHLEEVSNQLTSIVRSHVASAFEDAFVLAAIVVAFGIAPALFLRRSGAGAVGSRRGGRSP
jgi:EmrB/QacA subfamily drug resistance transporter